MKKTRTRSLPAAGWSMKKVMDTKYEKNSPRHAMPPAGEPSAVKKNAKGMKKTRTRSLPAAGWSMKKSCGACSAVARLTL